MEDDKSGRGDWVIFRRNDNPGRDDGFVILEGKRLLLPIDLYIKIKMSSCCLTPSILLLCAFLCCVVSKNVTFTTGRFTITGDEDRVEKLKSLLNGTKTLKLPPPWESMGLTPKVRLHIFRHPVNYNSHNKKLYQITVLQISIRFSKILIRIATC